jgi:hypothetical protein
MLDAFLVTIVYSDETFNLRLILLLRRGSSVSTVSNYGLDDGAIWVRSPAGANDFSSNLCVQTGSGAHPASYPMGTGVLSPGVKRDRSVTLTTHPLLVPRSWMSRSYTSSPPSASMACSGTALLLLLLLLLLLIICYVVSCIHSTQEPADVDIMYLLGIRVLLCSFFVVYSARYFN